MWRQNNFWHLKKSLASVFNYFWAILFFWSLKADSPYVATITQPRGRFRSKSPWKSCRFYGATEFVWDYCCFCCLKDVWHLRLQSNWNLETYGVPFKKKWFMYRCRYYIYVFKLKNCVFYMNNHHSFTHKFWCHEQ